VPQGMMPKAARERSASFRARAPPLLRPSKVPSRKAPSHEQDETHVTQLVTNVNDFETNRARAVAP
jgi:hypothetical protein